MAGKEEGAATDEFSTLVDRTSDLGSRIRVSLDFLCKNSTNLQEVLVHLLSHGLLQQHESEVIESEKSDYARFRQLFIVLIPRMGHMDNAQNFVNAFKQSLNVHILQRLNNADVTKDLNSRSPDASSQSVRFNVQEPVSSFVGRENFLHDLDQQILQSQQTDTNVSTTSTIISRICVVTGLGGIGKTETIRKYIHNYGHCYQHVIWIDAEEHKTAENQFRKLALQELKLPSKDIENNLMDFDVILKAVYDRLCTSNTLLVLDNAEALHDSDSQKQGVACFLPTFVLPTHVKPVVLITTRQLEWPDLHSTPLPLFTSKESRAFIFRQLDLKECDANEKDAKTLSETFGGLPLALQAAVAVIREESKRNKVRGKDVYDIQHLLSEYNQEKQKVLNKCPPGSPEAQPLMFLWKVSLDKIQQQPHGNLAAHILNVMAHLLSTNIPKKPLFFIFNSENSDSLVDAVKLLVDYSFVHDFHTHFSIHRVLQDVTLAHLEAQTDSNPKKSKLLLLTPPLTRIMTAVRKYWPKMPKSSEVYDAVHDNLVHLTMSHVLPKAQNPSKKDLDLIKFIEFVFKEIKDTRRVEAEKCCRVLITYFTNLAIPSRSASIFTSRKLEKAYYFRQNLAWILNTMGRYKEAADICNELLSFFNSMNGRLSVRIYRKHVMEKILDTKNTLASILNSQGEYEEAIKLYFCVLELCPNLHGPTHKLTLNTKNNLAIALQNSGRLSEAKTLYAEILEVMMKDLGPLHSDTLLTKHNTARILNDEGRYDDALKMFREVAEVQERELGPLHARTLLSNSCIADVLDKQGKHEDALRIYADVISRYEKASAASHPECLLVKNNMALILGEQGRLDEANEMFCHLLDIQERLLEPNHIYTLGTKHNLAFVLWQQGKSADALKLYEEVLELRKKQLGPVHPDTLLTNNNLGWLHLKMGNFEKAESIAKKVLAARQETLPSNHPDIKDTEELYEKAKRRNANAEEK